MKLLPTLLGVSTLVAITQAAVVTSPSLNVNYFVGPKKYQGCYINTTPKQTLTCTGSPAGITNKLTYSSGI